MCVKGLTDMYIAYISYIDSICSHVYYYINHMETCLERVAAGIAC